MKVRRGFVSNSSSMSFITRSEAYPSVFAIARRMLEIQLDTYLDDDYGYNTRPLNDREYEWIERLQGLIDKLNELEAFGMDPNTPVKIPSINFDSYIVRRGNRYYCNTSNNHCQWEDLDGIERRIHDDSDEDDRFYLPAQHFFYDVQMDIMMKRLGWREYPSEVRWCKHEHENGQPYTIERIMLESGEIVCRKCDIEKIRAAKVIQEVEP
jgi:hypothetical protein